MKIKVCVGESCHLQGAEDVVKTFKRNMDALRDAASDENNIQLMGCFCMNNCKNEHVSVLVENDRHAVRLSDADTFYNTHVKPKE